MTSGEFDRWSTDAAAGFAAQLTASGSLSAGEATAYATEQHAHLLADGVATPNHHFWTAVAAEDAQPPVGHLWHCVRPRGGPVESFVYDVSVRASLRGQGWGRAVMLAGESAARALGGTVSRLNVFGHNQAALALYVSLGYVVETVMVQLRVDVPDPRPLDAGRSVLSVPTIEDPGLGAIRIQLKPRAGGLHGFVPDLGAGEDLDGAATRHLVQQLRRVCRERGVSSLETQVPGANSEARRACDDEGLAVTGQLMSKPL